MKKLSRSRSRAENLFALLLILGLASACMGRPYKFIDENGNGSFENGPNFDDLGSGGGSSGSSGGSGSGYGGGEFAPLSFQVEMYAYEDAYADVVVNTNDYLKVQFTPYPQNKPAGDTGFFPQYAQLGVYIMVGDDDNPTPLLGNGFHPNYPQQTSPVLDYSDSFENECEGQPESCRQAVTIRVHKPNYDYWCFNFFQFCQHTHVYETHWSNGELLVYTNDTDPAP